MKYLLPLFLLVGCTISKDTVTPDEFHLGYSEADLNHDNSVFSGEQVRYGAGLTWHLGADRTKGERELAKLSDNFATLERRLLEGNNILERELPKLQESVEIIEEEVPQITQSQEEQSNKLKDWLLLALGGVGLGAGGIAADRKFRKKE